MLRIGWIVAAVFSALAAAAAAPALAAPAARNTDAIAPDPAVRLGVLPNGLRYAVMHNETPKGQVSIRLGVDAGSFEEGDDERGVAHFLEHMAFGQTRSFPGDALTKTFAPMGVGFGRDHNAATSMFSTVYQLDLPAADSGRLDLAFRWLRDVADGVELQPDAVERERRVVLAEREARLSAVEETSRILTRFGAPGLRSSDREPIGTVESIKGIDAQKLGRFYDRWYRPENAVVVVVGDLPVEALEQRVRDAFSSWTGRGAQPTHAPYAKPDETRGEDVLVRIDPNLPAFAGACRVQAANWAPYTDVTRLRRAVARRIWTSVLNERLARLAASADPPFVGANAVVSDEGREAQSACIAVVPINGQWRKGLVAAEAELKRFADQGLSDDEMDAAIVERRAVYRGHVTHAATRPSEGLAQSLVDDVLAKDVVPSPEEAFRAFDAAAETLEPADVKAAFAQDWSGSGPLLVAVSPDAIDAEALKTAWNQAQAQPQPALADASKPAAAKPWSYTDFGQPGRVVRHETVAGADFVRLTFANGVVVNFKPTKFSANSVLVRVRFGHGRRGLPKGSFTTATFAGTMLKLGGLGRHDAQELDTLFREDAWGASLAVDEDAFVLSGDTSQIALASQLQILAAFVSDPGFRPSLDAKLPTIMDAGYRLYRTSPELARDQALAGAVAPDILRLPSRDEMMRLREADFERLLKPALTLSPLEITIVGDTDEKTVIRLVAETFGALPQRAARPVPPDDPSVWVRFPETTPAEIRTTHEGPPEKADAAVVWPLYQASPERRREELTINLVAALLTNDLRNHVRQELGLSYDPDASATMPDHADQGYLLASVATSPETAERAAAEIRKSADRLARGEITAEELEIARKPLLGGLEQDLKSNEWWAVVIDGSARGDRSATEPLGYEAIYASISLDEVRRTAATWLKARPIVIIAMPAAAPPAGKSGPPP